MKYTNLIITFKNKENYNILDLQDEINQFLNVASLASILTSDDNFDDFFSPTNNHVNLHKIKRKFGKEIKVSSVTHQSPTLLLIIIGYRAAELILDYYNDENKLAQYNTGENKGKLISYFIRFMELLKQIIDDIKQE
jgi:hypothetical protein